jgi:hypothetical protein
MYISFFFSPLLSPSPLFRDAEIMRQKQLKALEAKQNQGK